MRILFTAHPLQSHIAQLIPLMIALSDKGHTIGIASSRQIFNLTSKFGFESLIGEPDWNQNPDIFRIVEDQINHLGSSHSSYVIQNLFIKAIGINSIHLMKDTIEYWKPDIIVSESTEFTGRIVAELNNLPVSIVSFGIEFGASMGMSLITSSLDELRIKAGLLPDPEFKLLLGDLSLCLAPPSFQPPSIPLSDNAYFFKPDPFDLFYQKTLPQWFNKLPNLPIVYITLGNSFGKLNDIFETLLLGLSNEPYNIILTTGKYNNAHLLKKRFPNVYIEEYIPHSLLIPYCSLIISHGGYGTIISSLSYCKPMILLPIGADNFLNANRCFDLGVAEVIQLNNLTPYLIRHTVNDLLNYNRFSLKSILIKNEINEMNNIEFAIPLIEKLHYSNHTNLSL